MFERYRSKLYTYVWYCLQIVLFLTVDLIVEYLFFSYKITFIVFLGFIEDCRRLDGGCGLLNYWQHITLTWFNRICYVPCQKQGLSALGQKLWIVQMQNRSRRFRIEFLKKICNLMQNLLKHHYNIGLKISKTTSKS